ncbi:17868_t:CDS:2 [Dentiscutata erythropus]|uniref:17868_t:CDS:1 n=1 Tax=Dentiscutata erythropus TaxID=1348616 RepID=A0A9N9H9V0_9GLOM|nr:17868_t:CDS:2 [Dentiscutata erythropus]
MSSSKRKEKTTLSNQQRKEIIEFKEKHPSISNVDLVDWVKKNMGLEVHPSTIGRLIKNKDNIGDNLSAKRQKTVQHPDLENSLLDQITQHGEDASVDDDVVATAIPKLRELLAKFDLKGRKKNKEQLTVAFCVNADGTDKLKPFVIGKYPNPRCFKGIKRNLLGITYDSSANA